MKKDKSLFLLYAFLILSVSCTRNITEDWSGKMLVFRTPHYLGTSTSSILFNDGNGGKQTISLSSTNTTWEITDLPEWLNADKTGGEGSESIIFTCLANPSPKTARAAVFYVRSKEKDWEYSIPVSVSQVRCLSYAIPAQTTISFEGKEGSQTISVNSNIDDWSIISSESWLTVEKNADGSVVTLTVIPNPNKTSRRAYVTIQTEDEERQITVDQRAGNISATMDKMDFSVVAEKKTVTIASDAPWTAQSSSSWIEINPSSGNAGSTEVSVRSTANNSFSKRSGYIYFIMADDNKIELPIEQEGVSFSLSTSSLEFDRTESTKTITIITNTKWELASGLPNWLSLSAKEGRGTTEVTITAKENQDATIAPRSFTISFKPKAIDKNFDVVLTQNGQRMNYEITPLQFSNKGGSLPFSFEATGNWSVTTSDSWITVIPTSGLGDATCVVTVTENTGDERIGEVILSFYEDTYHIPVTQQGIFLTLSTEGLQFGSTGGALQVDITSNTSWEAMVKDEAEWLSVNPTKGEEKGTITITASDNPSASSRDGKVLVIPECSQPLVVSIEQAARFLNVSTNSIVFLVSGGTSELITVDTDGIFEVTTESDWLTINNVSEKGFTVTANKNLSETRMATIVVSLTGLVSGVISRSISVTQAPDPFTGHDYVDLGLPSGLLWATMNVGAYSPDDYGDYFAWGETTTKSNYDWETYKWCKGDYDSLTKYNTNSSYGTVDNKTVLELDDDAAHVNWGGNWSIPSKDEFEELINNCTWTWMTQGGHEGYKVTSNSNENSIFLPAAGHSNGTSLVNAGVDGSYCSRSFYSSSEPYRIWGLGFYFGGHYFTGTGSRYCGQSVRPVCLP